MLVFQGNGCHHLNCARLQTVVIIMKIKVNSLLLGMSLVIALTLPLSACWTTVRNDNPQIQHNLAKPYARVYFIRPRTERYMGMPDNRVSIAVNKQPLLELVKGEYTYIDLIPGAVTIAISNQTTYGPSHKIKTETRSRPFTFSAGQTYFIAVTPTDGEFRGVRFVPRQVAAAEARTLADRARGVGNAHWKAFPDTSATAQPLASQ